MQQFEGRVAVVTGAGGKVGLALSRRFAREGMSVAMADVHAEDLEARRRSSWRRAPTPGG